MCCFTPRADVTCPFPSECGKFGRCRLVKMYWITSTAAEPCWDVKLRAEAGGHVKVEWTLRVVETGYVTGQRIVGDLVVGCTVQQYAIYPNHHAYTSSGGSSVFCCPAGTFVVFQFTSCHSSFATAHFTSNLSRVTNAGPSRAR